MYPFPSFGGFQFKRDETAIWGTDIGWAKTPAYNRQRPLGSAADVTVALSIGSAERSFEINLTPTRFAALEQMLNTRAIFTDWGRPTPDSRMAFLSEVIPVEDIVSHIPNGIDRRKRHVRIVLVSA